MSVAKDRKEKKRAPKLRFPGFGGEWGERRLGEIATFLKGKGISKSDIVENGKNKCIRYGELYTDYVETINKVVSRTNVSKKRFVLSQANDLLIPSSGETPIDIATVSCINEPDVLLGGDINIIRLEKDNKGVFFAYYLANKEKRNIAKMSQGNSVVHLYNSHLKNLIIFFPIISEQQKIANFLTSIDEWIKTLTAQKEKLEAYKKGIMQKIFSQEIRFKDDNGDNFPEWEEKRLGEMGEIKTSSVDKLTKKNQQTIKLVNYMDVYKRDKLKNSDKFQFVSAPESQIQTSGLKKGDILFTPSSETPTDIGHSAVVIDDLFNVLFSYHLVRFRPEEKYLEINFSAYAFKSFSFYKEFWRKAQGATRFTLSKKSIEESKILIPSSLLEQQKIADFLTVLDNLIEFKQTQIIKAKSWKKGLMQQLFV